MRFVVIFKLFAASVVTFALDTVSTGYRVNNGNTARVDAWGKCRDVTNSSGADHFLATKTQGEWWSFLTNTPTGLSSSICSVLPEYTTSPQKVVPSASVAIGTAGNGSAWANSAWVQMIASTSSAIVITGVVVDPQSNAEFEIDIGKGGAGSETVIATIPGVRKNGAGGPWWLQFPIAIDNVAAGTRVAIRFRKSDTSTTNWNFKLTYWDKPLAGGTVSTTANASKVLPSAASGVTVTAPGTAWTSTAWVQVTAATANAIVLGGIAVYVPTAGEFEVDVGTGAAGSETVVTTFRDISGNANSGPYLKLLKPALDNIGSGVRVAVRLRVSHTSSTNYLVKLLYYDSPVGLTLHDKPLTWTPGGTTGITITPNTTAWADSAWFELISNTTTDVQLASFCIFIGVGANYELEFGVGAAGEEVPIALYKGRPSNANLVDFTPIFYPNVHAIPSGTRLAVRLRKEGTSSTNWRVAAAYYQGSTASNKSAFYHKGLPAAANALNLTPNGTAWANSAWVEFSAGITEDILITSIGYDPPNNAELEVDIGTGAAGSETVRTTLGGNVMNGGGQQIIALPSPLRVTANTRIALRMRKETTTTVVWPFWMNYVHLQ